MMIGLGLASGVLAGRWAAALIASLLHGVTPADPMTHAAATALFALLGGATTLGAARRVAAVDPARTLRGD